MRNMPLISVIMPVYNAGRYVREAVESVLAQTYPNIELICIDDGSQDDSLAILRTFADRITVLVNETNKGIGATRNRGIDAARGEYLAFLDADDIWKSEMLASELRALAENPSVDICFSHIQCFISPDLPDAVKQTRFCPSDPMPGYIASTSLMLMETFRSVGYFNPAWRVGEFIDWMAKAKERRLTTMLLPDVFLLRRIHASNTGVTERPSRNDYAKILLERLKRQREAQKESDA